MAHSRIAWQRLRWQGWWLGLVLAMMAMVPLLNLLVPVLGIATATHLLMRGMPGLPRMQE